MMNMGQHQYILERDGCPVHYWRSERMAGPLVVFTHGAGADHHMFDTQIAALEDRYQTLTWDVRGHGCSRTLGAGFSIRATVADLIAILDDIKVQQAIFVGQSMGGNITQELVRRHPERVAALILVDCACNTFPLSAAERLLVRLTPVILRLYPYETLLRQSAKAAAVKPDVQQYVCDAMHRLSKDEIVIVLTETMKCLRDEPGYRIPKPFLLVRGEHDSTGAIAKQAPQWAARESQCRYVVIPNAGHCANQDNPEYFNQLMREFLSALM